MGLGLLAGTVGAGFTRIRSWMARPAVGGALLGLLPFVLPQVYGAGGPRSVFAPQVLPGSAAPVGAYGLIGTRAVCAGAASPPSSAVP